MQITSIDQLIKVLEPIKTTEQILLTYATDSGLNTGFSKTDLKNTKLFCIVEGQEADFNEKYSDRVETTAELLGREDAHYEPNERGKAIISRYEGVLPNKLRKYIGDGSYELLYFPVRASNAPKPVVTYYAIDGVKNTAKLKDIMNEKGDIDEVMKIARPCTQEEVAIINEVKNARKSPNVAATQSSLGIDQDNAVEARGLKIRNLIEFEMMGKTYEIYIR